MRQKILANVANERYTALVKLEPLSKLGVPMLSVFIIASVTKKRLALTYMLIP